MPSAHDFCPDWASAPGETISDILKERGLSVSEFAQQLGHTSDQAWELLQGRATITIRTARRLEQILGASVEFWMSRDYQYRWDISRHHATDDEWLSELPMGDMIKFGWLKPPPHPSEEVAACLRFFDMPSVQAWTENYHNLLEIVAFRKSRSFDSRPAAVAAWLRQGEIESGAVECDPWDPEGFQESLSNIRTLTRQKNPSLFIPELRKFCAKSGVALAIVRAPNGCSASGATHFLTQNKALLLLSFRHLSDDQFWFSFFHEAGHLILHGKGAYFLEGIGAPATKEEKEANEFAASTLVPPDFHQAMLDLSAHGREVVRFARRLGISPGIIVGQLQHYQRISHSQLNGLKRRFRWMG